MLSSPEDEKQSFSQSMHLKSWRSEDDEWEEVKEEEEEEGEEGGGTGVLLDDTKPRSIA